MDNNAHMLDGNVLPNDSVLYTYLRLDGDALILKTQKNIRNFGMMAFAAGNMVTQKILDRKKYIHLTIDFSGCPMIQWQWSCCFIVVNFSIDLSQTQT